MEIVIYDWEFQLLVNEFNKLVEKRNKARDDYNKSKKNDEELIIIPLQIRLRNIMCNKYDWGVQKYECAWEYAIQQNLIDEFENYNW